MYFSNTNSVVSSGPTNSGKTTFIVNLLKETFNQKFDFIFLLCPTFINNKTWDNFAENDKDFFIIIPEHHQINDWLKIISFAFEGTNTLIILDDCASSKDVKKRTNELVKLAFSARHSGISAWVLTQQMSSIAKPFRENIASLILFFTPSAKDMKTVFEEFAGDLTKDEKEKYMKELKEVKFSHLDFSLRHPFEISLN